jgi:hypothetical protein
LRNIGGNKWDITMSAETRTVELVDNLGDIANIPEEEKTQRCLKNSKED